jgi:predicted AAA+ superfamily ATPase
MGASRYISSYIHELALARNKMAFISGPRQVGKTTLAKNFAHDVEQFVYKNWDEMRVKKDFTKDPSLLLSEFIMAQSNSSKLLVLDEIHKAKNWKSRLKGLFDTYQIQLQFIVTGSAKLNVYKKGSDSLLGRYYHFRLHPFSLREALQLKPLSPEEFEAALFVSKIKQNSNSWQILDQLFQFSGFPEPFLAKNKKIHALWSRGRKEKIIREDILDLSRIKELSQIEVLCALLPEKIGSPLSVQSLREDLSCSHDSATRWLSYLKELYYFFEVTPYTNSITRTIKKEAKIYFYDWTECENDAAKFENMVASHLLKSCHFWEDTGEGTFNLHYLRNKEKHEVDFLIVKNKKPWFTVECKLSQTKLDTNYQRFQKQLKCPHIQVVMEKDIFQKVDDQSWIMGADNFLNLFV